MTFRAKQALRGFTLIELLVVIAIIGILSSIVLASLNTARVKSRNASYIAQANAYRSALELYFLEHGSYPQTTTYACMGTGHQSNSCQASSAYAESSSESVGFRSALASYIDTTTRASVQTGGRRGAIYTTHANPSTMWYEIILFLEGTGVPCPGAWTANSSADDTSANRTRCRYQHMR